MSCENVNDLWRRELLVVSKPRSELERTHEGAIAYLTTTLRAGDDHTGNRLGILQVMYMNTSSLAVGEEVDTKPRTAPVCVGLLFVSKLISHSPRLDRNHVDQSQDRNLCAVSHHSSRAPTAL